MEEMWFGIVIALAVAVFAIWIVYLIAKEFYMVAQAKGYPQKKYFWYCFLFGVVGYLLVIALPNCANTTNAVTDELPDL